MMKNKKLFYGIIAIVVLVVVLGLSLLNKPVTSPDKSKYCVDYLGNPEPEGPCSTVGIGARKCKNIGDCRATCAFGCMNKNGGISGRADCAAEPQYECECINNFCQIK